MKGTEKKVSAIRPTIGGPERPFDGRVLTLG
jgi:hypothetical protein